MKFCPECKTALSLFDYHENELCNDCLRKKKTQEKPLPSHQKTKFALSDCILSCEDDKMVLRTEEGTMLWSSASSEKNKLGSILQRAQRILEIRNKRNK